MAFALACNTVSYTEKKAGWAERSLNARQSGLSPLEYAGGQGKYGSSSLPIYCTCCLGLQLIKKRPVTRHLPGEGLEYIRVARRSRVGGNSRQSCGTVERT